MAPVALGTLAGAALVLTVAGMVRLASAAPFALGGIVILAGAIIRDA